MLLDCAGMLTEVHVRVKRNIAEMLAAQLIEESIK